MVYIHNWSVHRPLFRVGASWSHDLEVRRGEFIPTKGLEIAGSQRKI